MKLDSNGNLSWDRVFGGKGSDSASSVQEIPGGGYIVVGHKWSDSCDAWILRLDNNGDLLWDKTFSNADANCIQCTSDGGYIVSGQLIGSEVEKATWILKLSGK